MGCINSINKDSYAYLAAADAQMAHCIGFKRAAGAFASVLVMAVGTLYYGLMPASPTLDAWVREVVDWHFDPATGTPFWIEFARNAAWDPRRDVKGFSDLARFGEFQDEWLRGGPVQRWIPKALDG